MKSKLKYKRVLPFMECMDKIPVNSIYLYTTEIQVPKNSEEAKITRLIDGSDAEIQIIRVHVYEVSEEDFHSICTNGDYNKDYTEKTKIMCEELGIPYPVS